jgi:N-sulfoglucosamine sulfohydrolase
MRSCFALLVLSCSSVLCGADAQRPNVLLITVDDMHWNSVGAFGCPLKGITPNIDRLATQGMRLQRGHVSVAICMPTRAVWMTGRYPHRSGALGFNEINPGVPTLVEALHAAGFLTGLMAKEPHVVPSRHAAFDVLVPAKDLGSGRNPQLYAERSKEFFERAKASGKPFFLMANTQDPHRPFAGSDQEGQRRSGGKRRIAAAYPNTVQLQMTMERRKFLVG